MNLAVSAAVFSFLLFKFGGLDLPRRFAKADPTTLAMAVLILAALAFLHLVRWRLVLKRLGANIGAKYGLQLLFVGYFFNQTLPSSVGGDFSRIWLTNRAGVPLRIAIASVVSDRVSALLGLLALCIVLSPVVAGLLGFRVAVQIGLICLLLLGASGVFIAQSGRVAGVFSCLASFHHLVELAECIKRAFSDWKLTASLIALSAVVQFISGFSVFLIAKSLGINIGAMTCIALFPFINLATVVPISFAGWGIREGATISIFGLIGVSPEDAMSVSVLFGVALLITGIPGGILWFLKMHRIGLDAREQQARN